MRVDSPFLLPKSRRCLIELLPNNLGRRQVETSISKQSRQELTDAIRKRYAGASKQGKSKILDEFLRPGACRRHTRRCCCVDRMCTLGSRQHTEACARQARENKGGGRRYPPGTWRPEARPPTIDFLEEVAPNKMIFTHCTGPKAAAIMMECFKDKFVPSQTGLLLSL
jgi:hypothetical protein